MEGGQQTENLKLDVVDYLGKRVIFTEKKWLEKCVTHPDLRSNKFMGNVVKAIEKPQVVWQDYDDPERKVCYYWKFSTTDYVKVVIWIADEPFRVVSAYQTNYIKEQKYPNLKQLV